MFLQVQRVGLADDYSNDAGTRAWLQALLALPLLPKEEIRPSYEAMEAKALQTENEALEALCQYMRKNWVGPNARYSPDLWCVFGQAIRTNNDTEGWNGRLATRVLTSGKKRDLNVYRLVEKLYQEAEHVETEVKTSTHILIVMYTTLHFDIRVEK